MATPARRSPANEMNIRTSSGMLRNVSTYTPPRRWTHGDGAMRSAATRVPTTRAIANENPTSWTVTQKPEANWSKLSVRTSKSPLTIAASSLLRELERLVERHRRRLLLLVRVLADPLLVRLGPAAALLPLRDDVVDRGLEVLVAVLDAGAVGL